MNDALAWAGAVILLCLSGAVFLCALSACWDVMNEKARRRRLSLDELAIRRLGTRLHAASYWFSEDKAAYLAVRHVAMALVANGDVDVSAVRELWRGDLGLRGPAGSVLRAEVVDTKARAR
jgi:hypothetical protein